MDALARLQNYFRSLFQFDLADLDFGLYRLFHLERAEIESFIAEQLPREVEAAFAEVVGQETEQTRQRYERYRKELLENLGDDALLSDGRVVPEKREMAIQLPATRQAVTDYEAAREQYKNIEITEGHKAEVFNHLVSFFSRYYEEGDFIPKRRYGMREAYAVPYRGEEVFFHWANRDQHYVKTAERFQDYAFTVEDLTGKYRVRFTMAAASVPRDNTKGNTRFFFPRTDLATYEAGERGFILPFEYRLPTPEEAEQYGSNSRAQESILEEALPRILEATPDENLRALLARPVDESEDAPTALLKRLRHFCQSNTSDYFIHRDLRGFLARELAFYVKDQVVHLLDLEADLDAKRRVVRTFRNLAEKVIEFLAAIEEAQKTLFEKRKFVLTADYLIPIGHVPRQLWDEILDQDQPGGQEQLAEWERWGLLNPRTDLFNPSGAINETFLERHPSLPLHTRHFDRDFVRCLLEALPFDDLDDATDGLLVHGENYQALSLLAGRHRGQVKCVYIDPPYNRGGDDFIYKDRYQHSSWLAMMQCRFDLARSLLGRTGALFCHIDENEQVHLRLGLDNLLGPSNRIEELIWAQNTTHSQSPLYSTNHEYIEVYARDRAAIEQHPAMFREPKPGYAELMALVEGLNPQYPPVEQVEDEIKRLFERHIDEYKAELGTMGLEYNEETRKLDPWRGIYNYRHVEYRNAEGSLVLEDEASVQRARLVIWQEADASMPSQKQAESTRDPQDPNYRFYRPLHPRTGKPAAIPKRGWGWPYDWPDDSRDSFVKLDRAGRIAWGEDEKKVPRYKRFLHEVETNVAKSFFSDYTDGEKQIAALFGITGLFPTPKPTTLAHRIFTQVCSLTDTVLDYFAGSGTAGHAVIALNREDGGQRRFILVEMADYFDTVLLPRIAKVMYSPEWQDGQPRREATAEEVERSPRLVKVLRLESYEDALHNLAATVERLADDPAARRRKAAYKDLAGEDAYRLRYWIEIPLQEAATCLRALDLARPWAYSLEVLTDDGPVHKPVDMVETFNYLHGLRVQRYETWHNPQDGDRAYRLVKARDREGRRRILVIWRDAADLDPATERAFLEGRITGMAEEGEVWDEILINGDSPTPGVASLDALFKRLMMVGEGA